MARISTVSRTCTYFGSRQSCPRVRLCLLIYVPRLCGEAREGLAGGRWKVAGRSQPPANCCRQPLAGRDVRPLRLMQSDSPSRAVFPPPLSSLCHLIVGRVRNNCQEFQRPFLPGRLFTDQGKGSVDRRPQLSGSVKFRGKP